MGQRRGSRRFGLSFHHLICDGYARALLLHELGLCLRTSPTRDRLPPAIPAETFFRRLDSWYTRQIATAGTDANSLPAAQLPSDGIGQLRENAATVSMTLGPGTWNELTRTAQAHRLTPFAFALTAFQILIARLDQHDEVRIRLSVQRRQDAEDYQMVGNFSDLLTLERKIDLGVTCLQLARETLTQTLELVERRESLGTDGGTAR